MNYYTRWDVLENAQELERTKQLRAVKSFKYISALGFLLFFVFGVISLALNDDWAWTVAMIGGALWIIFGAAYKKNSPS